MGVGGAQKELATLTNYWARQGWSIQIVTINEVSGAQPKFPLDPKIEYVPLDMPAVSRFWPPKTKSLGVLLALRKVIRSWNPDVIVGFMWAANVLAIKAATGTRIPTVITEHLDPNQLKLEPDWERLTTQNYPRATALVAHTQRNIDYFPAAIRAKGHDIPSVLDPESLPLDLPNSCGADGIRRVIGVGRLDTQKAFDRLIEAFGQVAQDNPKWILEIYGQGAERENLETIIAKLGLQDRAFLRGVTHKVFEIMKGADFLVMSSRYEGFPLVLCEALSMGLPVVSFDCTSGPREIIRDGVDGILVPDGDMAGLAKAMDRLMKNDSERAMLAKNAPEILSRVAIDVVAKQWTNLFESVVKCR